MADEDNEEKLALGHQGSGDDCMGKMINFGTKGAVAGKYSKCRKILYV